jgi:competence protein ComEC
MRRGEGLLAPVLHLLRENLLAERDRWALWLPVAMGTGVALYFALPLEPPLAPAMSALAAATAALLLLRRRPLARVVLLGLGAALLGFAAAQLRTAMVAAPMLSAKLENVRIEGRVREIEVLPNGRRIELDDVTIQWRPNPPAALRLRLVSADPPLVPGDRIRVKATVGPPSRPAAPGAYDFRRDLFFDGIGGVGFALGRAWPARSDEAAEETWRHQLWRRFAELRALIERRIMAATPDPGIAGTAVAFITGNQMAVPKPTLQAMRDSGLAHLLSVSGLHVGLAAGILFFLLRASLALIPPVALRWPIKKWAALLALSGAGFYTLLSGASVPVVRSFLMTGIVLLAVVVDRRPISMRPVAIAAIAVLLLWPDSMVGPSFQLSFAAIIALTAAWEELTPRRSRQKGYVRRAVGGLGDLVLSSLIATLATAAFGIYHFDRVTGYGVIANMLAVPITGFWVMPWLILSLLLMPLGLEGLALQPAGWGIAAILWTARTVAGWPGAVALVPAMPPAGIVLVSLGGLWLCLWRRPWRLGGLAAIAGGFASILLVRQPDILVSEDARLVAVSEADGSLRLSSGAANRFVGQEWLRRAGEDHRAPWQPDGTADSRLSCAGDDCRYRRDGREVAILRGVAGLGAACATADMVISLVPVAAGCRAPFIDPVILARDGAHALWLGKDGVQVESVRAQQGERPWVPLPPPGAAGQTAELDLQ